MEQLEDDKTNAINERSGAESEFLAEQTMLRNMINDRNAQFAENEPGFLQEYHQTDSLKRIAGVELSTHLRRLGTAMADSVDLHLAMTMLKEEMDKKRASIEANEQVIETLQKVVDIKPDELLAELRDEKEEFEAEIEALKSQLKQLRERVNELLEGDQKSAEGPMVYYIPPPLEVIMKDKDRFEELKQAVAEAEVEYLEAMEFKASLQPKYAVLLEGISRNLSTAKCQRET
jgi:predicted RNase H-like nuclease (RuvC/YqgF family)